MEKRSPPSKMPAVRIKMIVCCKSADLMAGLCGEDASVKNIASDVA